MVRDRARLQGSLTNGKILKLLSKAVGLVLYSESIQRGSDHPSRRGRKLGIVNGDGEPAVTNLSLIHI